MDEKKILKEGAPTKVEEAQHAGPEDRGLDSSHNVIGPSPPQAEFDDYWAHKIAESAKKKVLTYFAVLGIVVSVMVTLFGMDRIRALVDEQYVNRLKDKEKQASMRVESLANTFEKELEYLQSRVEARSQEFHQIVGVTLTQIQERQSSTSGIQLDLSREIGPIRDQGRTSLSVGYAVAYALTAEYRKITGRSATFSARSIYVEARRKDEYPGEHYEGTSVLGAVKALKEVGAYFENDWPHERKENPLPNKAPAQLITSYTRIPSDRLDQVINSLKEGKPVIVSLSVTKGFSTVGQDGKIYLPEEIDVLGGHAVCLVGYNGAADEFKFANSCGQSWGESGFGYIRRSDLQRIIRNAFTVSI